MTYRKSLIRRFTNTTKSNIHGLSSASLMIAILNSILFHKGIVFHSLESLVPPMGRLTAANVPRVTLWNHFVQLAAILERLLMQASLSSDISTFDWMRNSCYCFNKLHWKNTIVLLGVNIGQLVVSYINKEITIIFCLLC